MENKILKRASMHRIIMNGGAERVSENAAIELGKTLEEIGLKISIEALKYTRHAKRKTVKDVDIKEAFKTIFHNI